MKKLTYNDVETVRRSKNHFMSFWKELNNELTLMCLREALYGDARNLYEWRPYPSPAEAAHYIAKLRGDR